MTDETSEGRKDPRRDRRYVGVWSAYHYVRTTWCLRIYSNFLLTAFFSFFGRDGMVHVGGYVRSRDGWNVMQ